MLFKSLFLFSALTATLVSAQSWLDSLGACEQRCAIISAEKVGCKADDYKCLCASPDFLKLFIDCTSTNCASLPFPGAPAPGYETFAKYCKSIDWTWDVSPCGKECIVKAAESVGCKWNDIQCLCRRREEFIKILTDCLASHCGDKDTIRTIIETLDRLCGTTSTTFIPSSTFSPTPTITVTTKPTTTFVSSTSTTCATITAWSTLTTTSVIVRTATVVVTSTSTFTATCPTTTVTTTVKPTLITSISTLITNIPTVKPTTTVRPTLTFNPTLIPVDPTKIVQP